MDGRRQGLKLVLGEGQLEPTPRWGNTMKSIISADSSLPQPLNEAFATLENTAG